MKSTKRKLEVLNTPLGCDDLENVVVITHFYSNCYLEYQTYFKGKNPNTSFQCHHVNNYGEALKKLKEIAKSEVEMSYCTSSEKYKSIVQIVGRVKYSDGDFSAWKVKQQVTVSNF